MSERYTGLSFIPEDKIVDIEEVQGRLIVYCEYSVWEIMLPSYGSFWQRQRLSATAVLSDKQKELWGVAV